MNVEIKEQMYEGKAKQVFATSDPEIVMVHYKDDATAGDGEKKGTIRDKGIVNNKLSNALMQKLERAAHFCDLHALLVLGAQHIPRLLLDFVEANENLFRSGDGIGTGLSGLVLQRTAKCL